MATQHNTARKLARLRSKLKRHGITLTAVGRAAGVTPQHVCHVFAGRLASRPVLETAKRLIAEAEARQRAAA